VSPRCLLAAAALALLSQARLAGAEPAAVADPKPGDGPQRAVDPGGGGLRGMLVELQKMQVRLEAALAVPVDGQDVRATFALELAAHRSHWWQLGLAYLPTTTVTIVTRTAGATERTVTTREELAVSLRLFKRFGPVVINAGLIESRVGAGVELRLVEDHLRLEALAHKRSRAHADLASVRVGASLQWRWFFVQAGVQDASDRRRRVAYLGGGMRWEDPDLKGLAFWFSRL
jgi:hypothetical protein